MILFDAVERESIDDFDAALVAGRIDETRDGEDVLMFAARRRDEEMVKHLLRRGANSRFCNSNGDTALHLACLNGQTTVVEDLLAHGADMEARGAQANRPIHLACAGGYEDVVGALVLRGCVLSAQNANGALPSTLCSNLEIKALVSDIEREGESARERFRVKTASRLAADAARAREEERRVLEE